MSINHVLSTALTLLLGTSAVVHAQTPGTLTPNALTEVPNANRYGDLGTAVTPEFPGSLFFCYRHDPADETTTIESVVPTTTLKDGPQIVVKERSVEVFFSQQTKLTKLLTVNKLRPVNPGTAHFQKYCAGRQIVVGYRAARRIKLSRSVNFSSTSNTRDSAKKFAEALQADPRWSQVRLSDFMRDSSFAEFNQILLDAQTKSGVVSSGGGSSASPLAKVAPDVDVMAASYALTGFFRDAASVEALGKVIDYMQDGFDHDHNEGKINALGEGDAFNIILGSVL